MQFSPKSVSIHEAAPASVASYNVECRNGAVVVASTTKATNGGGDGDVTIALGEGPDPIFTEAMVGTGIVVMVQEVGIGGELGPWQQAGGSVLILELPDGAETLTLNL